jgi:hypothetical protein
MAAVVSMAMVLAGCDSGEREDAESGPDGSTVAPEISVTIPPQRLTPFCQGMIELTDRLLNDPPDDPAAEIIATYESLVEVVPPEIEQEFLTVLARLQNGTPATTANPATTPASTVPGTTVADPNATETTSLSADEGYDPDEDPALRVNEYVQFACRDSVNNPGPAATQPGQTVAP